MNIHALDLIRIPVRISTQLLERMVERAGFAVTSIPAIAEMVDAHVYSGDGAGSAVGFGVAEAVAGFAAAAGEVAGEGFGDDAAVGGCGRGVFAFLAEGGGVLVGRVEVGAKGLCAPV